MSLNTRPARSCFEPWHGQKDPPGQSAPRPLAGPGDRSAVEANRNRRLFRLAAASFISLVRLQLRRAVQASLLRIVLRR